MSKKCAYILVGLPGSGKSTWAYAAHRKYEEYPAVISTDDVINDIADLCGYTYDECFPYQIDFAHKVAKDFLKESIETKRIIIVDQTNLSAKSRRRKLDVLKQNGYYVVAVVFPKPDDEEWARRLNRPGKTIPKEVLEKMESSFVYPTAEEGFDEIIEA